MPLPLKKRKKKFLLKIVLQFLLGKIGARSMFKIMLKSLHIGPGPGLDV